MWDAFWLSSFEKDKIRSPKTPKQGIFSLSLSVVKNFPSLRSTIVYKIIGFSFFLQISIIIKTWFSVLVKEYWLVLYLVFLNCAYKAKKILSRVSPVESETKQTSYVLFINKLFITPGSLILYI